jgi:putative flippase GtrA
LEPECHESSAYQSGNPVATRRPGFGLLAAGPYPDAVDLIRRGIDRWNSLLAEGGKFGIIGAINFGLDMLLYNVFYACGIPLLTAKGLATVCSSTSSYFMNKHWTYKDRPRQNVHREYILFFLFNAIGLAIQWGFLGLFKFVLHVETPFWNNVGAFLGIALGTLVRFWTYRKFVFLQPETDPSDDERELVSAGGRD